MSNCDQCGAPIRDGLESCQAMFDEVLAREFSDFQYGREHRLTVDAYSLQHPDVYMKSGKSFVAHLTGMYAAFERDDTAALNRKLQQWLGGSEQPDRPDAPGPGVRGELNIAHVHSAADAEDHVARVREWARSAWDAWSDHHALARRWVDGVKP